MSAKINDELLVTKLHTMCRMDTTYDFLSHVSNQEEEIERRATEQDTVINMYTLSHTYPPSLLLLLLAAHHHGYSLFTCGKG